MVSFVSNIPNGGSAGWRFELEGQAIPEAERRPAAAGVVASKDYFRLLGLAVVRGREFEDHDGLPGKEAAIVSQQFVARHYPNQDPIGKRLRLFGPKNEPKAWMTIIGVVPGFRQNDPSNPTNDSQVFVPHRFDSYAGMTILIRTQGAPASLAQAVRSEVQLLDEDLPLFNVESLEDYFRRARWQWRVFGTLFLIFAVVALGMAAVGIYAVMAHGTSRRTQEIGIRLALGAGFGDIMRLVLRRGLLQLILGMVLGVSAALAVCQLMARLVVQGLTAGPDNVRARGDSAGDGGAAGLLDTGAQGSKTQPGARVEIRVRVLECCRAREKVQAPGRRSERRQGPKTIGKPPDTCADGLSSPSGSRGALLNF